MGNKEIYILGVGRNTIVYIDLVESCGYKVAGLYHYSEERIGESIHGVSILDSNTNLFKNESLKDINFAISVGDNKIRANLAEQIRIKRGNIPTLIHPSAVVSKYAIISEGVVIQANSVVNADVIIEQDTVLSYNVSVAHTTEIGRGCYLASGSIIGAYLKIENNAFIGQAAVIVSGKLNYIGFNSVIGAGSIVINNVESNTIVAGNPAKLLKGNMIC